jgi:hypothetical protein
MDRMLTVWEPLAKSMVRRAFRGGRFRLCPSPRGRSWLDRRHTKADPGHNSEVHVSLLVRDLRDEIAADDHVECLHEGGVGEVLQRPSARQERLPTVLDSGRRQVDTCHFAE